MGGEFATGFTGGLSLVMRVLFAWELGDNQGHLLKTIDVAMRLRELQVPVLFVVRNTSIASKLLTPRGFRYLQAPVYMRRGPFDMPLASYASILLASGYDRKTDLLGLVDAWLSIIQLYAATVVVADHAPTALLAARIANVSSVNLGTGFEVPPAVDPFPPIPMSVLNSLPIREAHQSEALSSVNYALLAHSALPLVSLSALFCGLPSILTTTPDLDHYGARAGAIYVGAVTSASGHPRLTWPTGNGIKVFAYLHGGLDGISPFLSAIHYLDASAICVLPDVDDVEIARRSPNIHVTNRLVDVEYSLTLAHVVISNGGAGLIARALSSAIPVLLMPTTAEQYMSAERVASLGAGITVRSEVSDRTVARHLKRLTTHVYRQAATSIQNKMRHQIGHNPSIVIADHIIAFSRGRSLLCAPK